MNFMKHETKAMQNLELCMLSELLSGLILYLYNSPAVSAGAGTHSVRIAESKARAQHSGVTPI